MYERFLGLSSCVGHCPRGPHLSFPIQNSEVCCLRAEQEVAGKTADGRAADTSLQGHQRELGPAACSVDSLGKAIHQLMGTSSLHIPQLTHRQPPVFCAPLTHHIPVMWPAPCECACFWEWQEWASESFQIASENTEKEALTLWDWEKAYQLEPFTLEKASEKWGLRKGTQA